MILRALPLLLAFAAQAAPDGFDARMAQAREAGARALAAGEPQTLRDAYESFVAAAALRPADPAPPAEAGLLALAAGDGPFAARMLDAAGKAAPGSAPFRFLRASLHFARGEFDDALPDFRAAESGGFRADAAGDRAFECLLGRGLRLLEERDLVGGAAALADAAAKRPRHPLVARALREAARAHRTLRRPVDAERVLRDCVARFPTYAPARADLGDLLSDLSRTEESLAVLDAAVRVDPACADAHLARASAFTKAGRTAEAEASFSEFSRLSPPTAESEYRRGLLLRAKKAPQEALDAFRRSLSLEPEGLRPLYEISLCLRDLGLEEEADAALAAFLRAEEARRAKGHGPKPAGPPPGTPK